MRVPGCAVLVVVSLPGTAPAGEDVQAAPGQAHVVQLLGVHMYHWGGLHLLVHLLRLLRTNLAAGEGVWSLGLLTEAGRQWRTLLFVAVDSQAGLL